MSWILIFAAVLAPTGFAQNAPAFDTFQYGGNTLKIHFIGHATLMLDFNGTIIHVDPVNSYVNYDHLPKADIILITHNHSDHFDRSAIEKISKESTVILANKTVTDMIKKGIALADNGIWESVKIRILAVPAYNTTAGRTSYHPRGRDNGYVLELGGKRVYIAGDTEDIPEMANLKNIDIAFLPMNQPYTMTPEQVANAVRMVRPGIVYPSHFGETDTGKLATLLADVKTTEIRIRALK
ncbi:MAG: MBL fold metallo-hydrolase [Spirochaetaceae bacterium]|nr:MAG: MBL fold metallo-hydrolase [Spirochaetaceae bacterium]